MSGDYAEKLAIIAQELDRIVQQMLEMDKRIEALEAAQATGKFALMLPCDQETEFRWTITPIPKFQSCPP